ncbi:MAG: hypothetical protein H6739_26450 [Alphaproteobacteria bacterium]|nr:hypothetical protein [Alphaproteobacteria bacterium]
MTSDTPSSASRWVTRIIKGVPRDLKIETETGRPLAVARWTAPLTPARPDHCADCGGARRLPDTDLTREGGGVRLPIPVCDDCGLTAQEDYKLHEKILQKLRCTGFVEGADRAARTGRHVLALKLATAGVHYGEDIPSSRLQRIRELDLVGCPENARADLAAWLEIPQTSPTVAIDVAEMQRSMGWLDRALQSLTDALRRDPNNRALLVHRATIALESGAASIVVTDASRCLGPDDEIAQRALALVARLAELFIEDHRVSEAIEAIDRAAPYAHRDPRTTWLLARAEQARGQLSVSRRWLKQTLHIDPDHAEAIALLQEIEEQLGIASTV